LTLYTKNYIFGNGKIMLLLHEVGVRNLLRGRRDLTTLKKWSNFQD